MVAGRVCVGNGSGQWKWQYNLLPESAEALGRWGKCGRSVDQDLIRFVTNDWALSGSIFVKYANHSFKNTSNDVLAPIFTSVTFAYKLRTCHGSQPGNHFTLTNRKVLCRKAGP